MMSLNRRPSRVDSFAGKTLVWWLGDELHAKCGAVDIVLHHHPVFFSERPWSVEIFGNGPRADQCWHYSGQQFKDRPTDEQFQEIALGMLRALHRDGRI